MTGEVVVNICATHKDEHDSQVLKYTHMGKCRKNSNSTILMYDSTGDESDASVDKNIITIKEDSIEHTKRGTAVTRFVFKENKRTKVSYVTPYGGYNMDIFTKCASVMRESNRLILEISYDLLEGREEDCFEEEYAKEEIISSVMMRIEIINT